MILYNTIVGLAAGVALILLAGLFKQLANGAKVQPEGYALSFGATGFVLTVPGTTICVMLPYTKVLHANIMMGEPALATSSRELSCIANLPRFYDFSLYLRMTKN
jgi:hypothetical protein